MIVDFGHDPFLGLRKSRTFAVHPEGKNRVAGLGHGAHLLVFRFFQGPGDQLQPVLFVKVQAGHPAAAVGYVKNLARNFAVLLRLRQYFIGEDIVRRREGPVCQRLLVGPLHDSSAALIAGGHVGTAHQ